MKTFVLTQKTEFYIKPSKNCTFGGIDNKKYKFRNIDGINYSITNASGKEFIQEIDINNNYLIDDHLTLSIVRDWRIESYKNGIMKIYTLTKFKTIG